VTSLCWTEKETVIRWLRPTVNAQKQRRSLRATQRGSILHAGWESSSGTDGHERCVRTPPGIRAAAAASAAATVVVFAVSAGVSLRPSVCSGAYLVMHASLTWAPRTLQRDRRKQSPVLVYWPARLGRPGPVRACPSVPAENGRNPILPRLVSAARSSSCSAVEDSPPNAAGHETTATLHKSLLCCGYNYDSTSIRREFDYLS